ncbi:MAG: Ig-like domain-containing protein [Parvularculaceae bacterium]
MAEHLALLDLVPVAEATHVAARNGAWFDAATWGGAIPGDGARVHIPHGVSVTYDGSSDARLFTVRIDGALNVATDRDTAMTVDTLVVAPQGAMTVGGEATPMEADARAVITIADNGPIDVSWDPTLLSRGVVSHGCFQTYGAPKENFLAVASSAAPLAGDASLTLAERPAGWRVGDEIVLTGTHLVEVEDRAPRVLDRAETQDERRKVTRIEGATVFFDEPLRYDHDAPRSDLRAYVANMTRNVRIETENAEQLPVWRRGHVMLMHSNRIDVRYTELHELGRTDKSRRSLISAPANVRPDTNVQGRYSIHIHRVGLENRENPAKLIGNAVTGSPGWAVVHHDSHAIVSSNNVHNVTGSAFVAEAGNETGRWADNIAIRALGENRITKNSDDTIAFDLGRGGVGFWFQSRMVAAVDNVASDMPGGTGYIYYSRGTDPFDLRVDVSGAPQPDALRYLDEERTAFPSINGFSGNEAIATEAGFEAIKNSVRQRHDLRSVIDDFTAWETRFGVHLDYTGRYTFKDLDLLASDADFVRGRNAFGMWRDRQTIDLTVNRGRIEGFRDGVLMRKELPGEPAPRPDAAFWNYAFIDVDIVGAEDPLVNLGRNDLVLESDALVDDRLELEFDDRFPIADVRGGQRYELPISGVKTDSIGATGLTHEFDPFILRFDNVRGAVRANGYWTLPDGRVVTLIEEYFADRARAQPMKKGLFAVLPDDIHPSTGRLGQGLRDNGVLDVNSADPVARPDRARVKAGEKVVIRPLANDSDPDGDDFVLDGVWSPRGEAKAKPDGTITYVADGHWSGEDRIIYWIKDANGKFHCAPITVTVTR